MTRYLFCRFVPAALILVLIDAGQVKGQPDGTVVASHEKFSQSFQVEIQPFLKRYCFDCHGEENATSGIRVDHLTGEFPDRTLKLWSEIAKQISSAAMPPEETEKPGDAERKQVLQWIRKSLHVARSRPVERNGTVRRLTVVQYRNTLRSLLGLNENVAQTLPPDAVSEDGFTNNDQSMTLSPLQIESYIEIASRALDLCIVDPNETPRVQHFRMDLGKRVNPDPFGERLILGANNHLLDNSDFVVTQPIANRPFPFQPNRMRAHYRFHEGYEGNNTVRGWREYTSIYHSVFACMRGNSGYPKGNAYDSIPDGLLLRPAIPSRELFQVESTYGPRANFKIAVRELPQSGNFRVKVHAAKYDDGLLLGPGDQPRSKSDSVVVSLSDGDATVQLPEQGIYQVDLRQDHSSSIDFDDSRLNDDLIAHWDFDKNVKGRTSGETFAATMTNGAKFVDSPFGKSIDVDGKTGGVIVARDDRMNVGVGEFTVAAWVHPRQLKQGGIVCLGKYSWTHGWYLDMPNDQGVIRIETAGPNHQANGTVQSPKGTLRKNRWQHIAAVVRREPNRTELFVNGYKVASGSIRSQNLDNPDLDLHIGRIPDSNLFNGQIDEVRIYRRALARNEIQALVEPGRAFAKPPPSKPKPLTLQLGDRYFSGMLKRPAFLAVRLPATNLRVRVDDTSPIDQVVFTRLAEDDSLATRFRSFEQQPVYLGVHVGLRRDCGHTMRQVDHAHTLNNTTPETFTFVGAINNFPSPDVQEDNDNYLAGVREIGVRSEYTDGRDRPRLLVKSVEFEGPYYESWPPKSHRRIFVDSPNRDDEPTYAREVISDFATRAFRRPVRPDEIDSLFEVYSHARQDRGFAQSVKDALTVVLSSPQFLFLTETSKSPQPEPLDDHELASKLSYFLWNAPPDSILLDLAKSGDLSTRLDVQLDRMIDDTRFDQFCREFASQWLALDKFDVVEIDRQRFPRLTRETAQALRNEPAAYLKYLFRENLPARNLIASNFVVSNEVTASYYGLVASRQGFDFSAVNHQTEHLGGLLTQAGILAGLSDGREPNPVKRGAWLARKIIADPPDDPPPNVPDLPQDNSNLSLRERIEKHRSQNGCVKCHEGIDPWGLPFQQFGADGLLSNPKNDSTSTLPDATKVDGVAALARYLIEKRQDAVAFSVLKHLTTYACGRSLSYSEVETLRTNALDLKANGYRMRDMIHHIIHSDAFLTK